MVSCRQCNIQNSLDSTFCKRCGATLNADDIAAGTEKLEAMIADGNKLFADGRTDDAMMVAETAVTMNPTSAAAISLKGMCFERKGQLSEALECFERVVALNPDSTLDKLKVNDLRNMMVVEKFEVAQKPGDRRVAVVGAVAATVLVVAVGAMFAKASAKTPESKPTLVAMNEQPTQDLQTFGDVMSKQKQETTSQPTDTNTNTQPNVTQPPVEDGNGESGLPRGNGNGSRIKLPPFDGQSLPDSRGRFGDSGYVPLNPRVEGPIGGNQPDPNKNNQDKAPSGTNGKGVDEPPIDVPPTTGKDSEVPKNDPGIIEIEVSKGSGPKGTGDSGSSSNGRQALTAAARSQFSQGNYAGAANSYERALRMGADQASTNQRLGQCYAHLGKSGDAIAAYTRAANAYEKSGNTQARDACQQAIKVLGGG